jgi:DNA polymerase-3 subunit epsilon
LLDAELLAQVYLELMGGRQWGLELSAEAAAALAARGPERAQRVRRAPRPHKASAEELARHRAFLEGISKPLWLA